MKNKSNLKRLFIFNGLLLLIAFTLLQYSIMTNDEQQETEIAITEPSSGNAKLIMQGSFTQQFTLYDKPRDIADVAFKTAFDHDAKLSDYRGDWILLNLWATWCPPCLIEMPSLQALQNKYEGAGLKVIAVALDRNMDGKTLREFFKRFPFGPVAAYYGHYPTINEQLEVYGFPTTYVINPNGKAIGHYQADTDWVDEDAVAFIESLRDVKD